MTLSIFDSYLLYFGSFALASIFAALYARSNNIFKYLFFILAISVPALVAALRDASVGTDYQWYFYHISQFTTKVNSISDFASLDSNFEIGKEMENLAEKSLHWKELYDELKQDRNVLYNDIISLIQRHKIVEEG